VHFMRIQTLPGGDNVQMFPLRGEEREVNQASVSNMQTVDK